MAWYAQLDQTCYLLMIKGIRTNSSICDAPKMLFDVGMTLEWSFVGTLQRNDRIQLR